ncbi:hypothetical protein PanWU01x14_024810, partial [Parasponia andersonii]
MSARLLQISALLHASTCPAAFTAHRVPRDTVGTERETERVASLLMVEITPP